MAGGADIRSPVPAALTAATRKKYCVRLVKPVTVCDVVVETAFDTLVQVELLVENSMT